MSGDNEQISEKHLQNWQKWKEEWEGVQAKMCKKLHTETGNLVMNYSDGLCHINQEKQLLEAAKIPTKFDKYRGDPNFYKLPTALPQKTACCCGKPGCKCRNLPQYFVAKTKPEIYNFVGAPEGVRNEKNILTGTRDIYKRWQSSKYRQEQMAKWSRQIKNLVPHIPDLNLMVRGENISNKEALQPEEEETAETEVEQQKKEDALKRRPKSRISINEHRLCGDNANLGTIKIRVFFHHDCASPRMTKDFLFFKNGGSTALRVHWKKIEKFRLFSDYPREIPEHSFYFDKREFLILPDAVNNLEICFDTKHPGTYSEVWEISTMPRMWNENSHVLLVLQANACFEDFREDVNNIVEYIDEEARRLLIQNFLYDLIQEAAYEETPVRVCSFGEEQLFEMANLSNNRPFYLYKKELVDELQETYQEVKEADEKWDYCVKKLAELAHQRDVKTYFNNKCALIQGKILAIEESKTEQKKDAQENKKKGEKGSKKSASKDKASKTSKSSKKDNKSKGKEPETVEVAEVKEPEPFDYSFQTEVEKTIRKFETPIIPNTERVKYFACYSILLGCFNKLCQDLAILENENEIKWEMFTPIAKHQLLPIEKQPQRNIYEFLEDLDLPKTFPCEESLSDKRKPDALKEIPADDIEAIYKTYFNKEDTGKKGKEKGKKSKTETKASSKKSKSTEKKTKSDKSQGKMEESVKEEILFNPYEENFIYDPELGEFEKPVLPPKLKTSEEYKYKQYLIVYSALSKAADAVVDTIETFNCSVSYQSLKAIKPQMEL